MQGGVNGFGSKEVQGGVNGFGSKEVQGGGGYSQGALSSP